jgi:hypothetical protein
METATIQVVGNRLDIELVPLAPEPQIGLAPILVSAQGEQSGDLVQRNGKMIATFDRPPTDLTGAVLRLPVVIFRVDASTSQPVSGGGSTGPNGETYSISEKVVDAEHGVVALHYIPDSPDAPLVSRASIRGNGEVFHATQLSAGYKATTRELGEGDIIFPIEALPLIESGVGTLEIREFRAISEDMIMLENAG